MKVLSANEAAGLVPAGATVALSGSGACNLVADRVLAALEKRFLETGAPSGLTVFHPQGIGDKKTLGLARFAHEGMVKRVIGGHWGLSPAMGRLALEEKVEAYNLPQGVMAQMMRAMADKGPGVITKIGLDTYIDPRQSGGKMNRCAQEDLVEEIRIDGERWLRYRPIPIDVAILRGTTADEDGYISFEEEVHYDEAVSMAAAAKANGGLVIVQVKRMAKRGTLPCVQVRIPCSLVDCVVVAPEQPQSLEYFYRPGYCGALQETVEMRWPDGPMDVRKFIARRQALELRPGMLVNIGLGISNGVPIVLAEEGVWDSVTFSLEQGQCGGVPVMGPDAGTMLNPRAIVEQPVQHDIYHGGLLDAACLSAAEIDPAGNVNVSKMGENLTGCGGFIDISQETPRLVFACSFCAKSRVSFAGGRVTVLEEGSIHKFVKQVQQITFSGPRAVARHCRAVFVTERCVFLLTPQGLMLTEIAPGIDLERDILRQMDFRPILADPIRLMPQELFAEGPMGLSALWAKQNAQDAVRAGS
jgi:propionate CoA-transferase